MKRKRYNEYHGKTGSREYQIWSTMKARCYSSSNYAYRWYGARGIRVCDRWRNSFIKFYSDMGDCPESYSIERIDNDGDYTPSNCKWIPRNKNRRSSILQSAYGITANIEAWADSIGISHTTVRRRIKEGWSMEKIHKHYMIKKLF